jgi:hypothetical protein
MQLTKKTKVRGKTARGTPRLRAPGAGRKSLFPGKNLSRGRHAIAYLTPDGWAKLDECRDILLERCKRDDITRVTVSDTLEAGIHKLHRELTRNR